MNHLLTELPDLVVQFGPLLVVVILGMLLAGGFGFPLPEDVPLLAAGYLCHVGIAPLWLMIPLCLAAVLGADCTIYWIGRRYGQHIPNFWLFRRLVNPRRLDRAAEAFHEHGGKTLFIARFLPGLRTPVFFSAGLFKIPFWKLLAFDGSASLISVPTLVLLAYFFGAHLDHVLHWADRVQMTLGLTLGTLIVLAIAWKVLRRKRCKENK